MKTCITCGETKPLTDYYKDRDGHKMRCKPCHREWRWKGRKPGEPVPRCKLTPEDVLLIRGLLSDAKYYREQARKLTLAAIAEKFEVSKQTICEIGQLRSWAE